jgi:hypothetical protein
VSSALEPERHIRAHIEVREQSVMLKDHSEAAMTWRDAGDVTPFEYDSPRVRRLEPRHHPQRRRLSATAGAKERDDLMLCDIE